MNCQYTIDNAGRPAQCKELSCCSVQVVVREATIDFPETVTEELHLCPKHLKKYVKETKFKEIE